jgi:hypothetical protein
VFIVYPEYLKTNQMQQYRSLGPNSIFAENLPDEGTFMQKYVAVGT